LYLKYPPPVFSWWAGNCCSGWRRCDALRGKRPMNSKTHSPSCATNGLNIGARNRVIVLAQRHSLGFRPFLSFAFICPSTNSAGRGRRPYHLILVPRQQRTCGAQTRTKSSPLDLPHRHANEETRKYRANSCLGEEQIRSQANILWPGGGRSRIRTRLFAQIPC
jgi:hypothetical protein